MEKELNNGVKPVIYQLIPRLFCNRNERRAWNGDMSENGSGKLNDLTVESIGSLKGLGATHLWLTGVIEHAQQTDYSRYGIRRDNSHVVKGKAGSPYAIKDYYDIDPDVAVDVENRMGEFEAAVKRIHDEGLGVIIDFVPNHVAREYHSDAAPEGTEDLGERDDKSVAFRKDNNFYYIPGMRFVPEKGNGTGEEEYTEFPAKATGNDCFTAFPSVNDWYETAKLNYGIDYRTGERHFDRTPDTWKKMCDILLFWCGKGVDGFRCDMAHMVPVEFWSYAIGNVKGRYPGVKFIAELYDTGLYRDYIFRGGFDYLYDKVNLYDTLRSVQTEGLPAGRITWCWQRTEGLSAHLLNFLENHDEQRFASEYYAGDCMKVLPSLAVSAMIGDGAMMVYMGQELGERGMDSEGFSGRDGRTTIFDYWSIETLNRWLKGGVPSDEYLTPRERLLRGIYGKILRLCNENEAVRIGGFFDLMYANEGNATFNGWRQYGFLRFKGDKVVLVAVNFGDTSCDGAINIPSHAFECAGIEEGDAVCRELLSGDERRVRLSSSEPFRTYIGAWGASIWEISVEKNPRKREQRATKKRNFAGKNGNIQKV